MLGFFKDKVLAASRPLGQEGGLGKGVTLRAAIDAAERAIGELFTGQPSVEASIRDTLGQSYYYEGAINLAIRQYERALASRPGLRPFRARAARNHEQPGHGLP